MLPNDFAVSQNVRERFSKLYRKLHHLFIVEELTHVDDFKREIDNLHKRIDQLNSKLDSNLQKISQIVNSHFHLVPQAPAGTLPSQPIQAKLIADSSPVVRVPFSTIEMTTENLKQLAKGPALAPLAAGLDKTTLAANLNSVGKLTAEV